MGGFERDLDREELFALVRELRAEVRALRVENERLQRRTEELERQLAATGRPTPRLDEPYSPQAEQQRQDRQTKRRRRQRSARRGRKPTQDKLDAAEHRGFSNAQKCWAHLIRKAIRLTLLAPRRPSYRRFLGGLVALYRDARRPAQDQRLSADGRRRKVDALTDQLCRLLGPHTPARRAPASDVEREFANLVEELARLVGDDELFTFVVHPAATGTNNEDERPVAGPHPPAPPTRRRHDVTPHAAGTPSVQWTATMRGPCDRLKPVTTSGAAWGDGSQTVESRQLGSGVSSAHGAIRGE